MITIKLKDEDAILLSAVISQYIEDGNYSGGYSCNCTYENIKFLEYLSDTICSVAVDSNPEYVVYRDLGDKKNV